MGVGGGIHRPLPRRPIVVGMGVGGGGALGSWAPTSGGGEGLGA